MFEPLRDVLQVIVYVAIIVTIFGLLTRSELRAARLFGWFCMAWALSMALIEGYDWHLKGDWVIRSAQEVWYQVDRESLNALEATITNTFSAVAWALCAWILSWPAWLVLTILGLILLLIDHVQMMRRHKGAPPPPLWKRLYRWLKDVLRDKEPAEEV
jgi:hypothetical protein